MRKSFLSSQCRNCAAPRDAHGRHMISTSFPSEGGVAITGVSRFCHPAASPPHVPSTSPVPPTARRLVVIVEDARDSGEGRAGGSVGGAPPGGLHTGVRATPSPPGAGEVEKADGETWSGGPPDAIPSPHALHTATPPTGPCALHASGSSGKATNAAPVACGSDMGGAACVACGHVQPRRFAPVSPKSYSR